MRVNHRRVRISMAHQVHHRLDVIAATQAVGDKGMAQRVRRDALDDAGGFYGGTHGLAHAFIRGVPAILPADEGGWEQPLPAELTAGVFIFLVQSPRQFHQAATIG